MARKGNVVSRWWRGRGFGVHSPFAFAFITETLHCPHRYYAYETIAAEAHTNRERRDAERLFRIVLRFRPRRINRYGTLPPALETAVAEATAGYRIASECDFIIVADKNANPEILPETIAVFVGEAIGNVDFLTAGMDYGMIFRGTGMAVAVASQKLPQLVVNLDI